MKSNLLKSIGAITGAVALGICFTGPAEAMSLGLDRLGGANIVDFADASIDSDSGLEGAQDYAFGSPATISQILWSGTEAVGDFSVRLFSLDDLDPLSTLTGSLSSFVEPIRLYDEPTVVDVAFYTLDLDTPLSVGAGEYVFSIRNTADWGWTRVDGGTALFRFDDTDPWRDANMSSGAFDLQVKNPTSREIPTPALLPGLIGLGVAKIRKLRKDAATTGL